MGAGKLAGDTIFVKFCQDALSHILSKTPQEYTNTGCGLDGLVWVDGDGRGWVWMGVWD